MHCNSLGVKIRWWFYENTWQTTILSASTSVNIYWMSKNVSVSPRVNVDIRRTSDKPNLKLGTSQRRMEAEVTWQRQKVNKHMCFSAWFFQKSRVVLVLYIGVFLESSEIKDGMLMVILAPKNILSKTYFFKNLKLTIFSDVNQSYNSDTVKTFLENLLHVYSIFI